jgi:hypothetical protein
MLYGTGTGEQSNFQYGIGTGEQSNFQHVALQERLSG